MKFSTLADRGAASAPFSTPSSVLFAPSPNPDVEHANAYPFPTPTSSFPSSLANVPLAHDAARNPSSSSSPRPSSPARSRSSPPRFARQAEHGGDTERSIHSSVVANARDAPRARVHAERLHDAKQSTLQSNRAVISRRRRVIVSRRVAIDARCVRVRLAHVRVHDARARVAACDRL